MRNKKGILLIIVSVMAGAAYSQTSSRVAQALNDPKRAQNEAKADVYIQRKQHTPANIVDTTVTTQPAINKKDPTRHLHKKSRR